MNIRIGAFIILLCFFSACRYPKCTKNFRATKKILDTYVLMEPVVSIYARVQHSMTSNPPLSASISTLVDQITNETLSKKFRLKKIDGPKYRTSALDSLYNQIDHNRSKELKGVFTIPTLNTDFIGQPERYGLLISIVGFYNPNFNPHHNLSKGMASNSIIINSNTKPRVFIRIMVIDFEINELVYYDKFSTDNYDPRVESEMAQIIKRRLRKIYYR